MDQRSRHVRREAAAGLRAFTPEEQARLARVVLPYAVVSLVAQVLLLVVGVRTVRELYRSRQLGARQLLGIAANGPLLGLSVLSLAQIIVSRRLSRWARRMNASPPE
jgi:hypothetical protein